MTGPGVPVRPVPCLTPYTGKAASSRGVDISDSMLRATNMPAATRAKQLNAAFRTSFLELSCVLPSRLQCSYNGLDTLTALHRPPYGNPGFTRTPSDVPLAPTYVLPGVDGDFPRLRPTFSTMSADGRWNCKGQPGVQSFSFCRLFIERRNCPQASVSPPMHSSPHPYNLSLYVLRQFSRHAGLI